MTFFELIIDLNNKGINVTSSNDELSISAPVGSMNEELLGEIKKYKQNFLSVFSLKISKAAIKDSYPLFPAQKRFWILSKFEGAGSAYNIPISLKISGELNLKILEKALNILIERHEILRTVFKENENGEINQFVIQNPEFYEILFKNDLSENEAIEFIENVNSFEFDLSKMPLIKVAVCEIEQNHFILTIVMHHIISDEWSLKIFFSELLKLYLALIDGKQAALPEVEVDFKDYSEWFNDQLENKKLEEAENFWINQFKGEITDISLPISNKRPLQKTFNGNSLEINFDSELFLKIKSYSKQKEVSVFTLLMAVINAVLYRYSSQKDLVIGIPISGRNHSVTKDIIGLLINSLPIYTAISDDESFESLLLKENEILREAYSNQIYPFDLLIEKLKISRDSSRSPLFDIMVSMIEDKMATESNISGLNIEGMHTHATTSQFDMVFQFAENIENLSLVIKYNTDLFEAFYVEKLLNHIENFIIIALDDPLKKITSIDILTEEEEKAILFEFNNTKVQSHKDDTIVGLFEEQALKIPNKTAIIYNYRFGNSLSDDSITDQKRSLTYEQLRIVSNKIANILVERYNVQKGDLVGVLLEKSEWLIPVLLGILKAGSTYVPIDPDYPDERKEYFKTFTKCKLIIDSDILENFINNIDEYNDVLPCVVLTPDHLVHVMFTSGSTGNPKGVMLNHANIVGLIKPCTYMDLNEETVLLSTVSVSFDTTNIEFWGVLVNGGKIILESKEYLLDYSNIKKTINKNNVNTFFLTSSWFESIVENDITIFENVNQFLTGGDIVSYKHINLIRNKYPMLKIIHCYGPTEDTTFSTTYLVEKEFENNIPIGKPIDNGKAYILNKDLLPQPIGVTGTLFVGGVGVAQGYFNNLILTEEKFIENPFNKSEKLYNTGDLAKWLPDGNIDFIGRIDRQIKIRGKIIDTTEIENILNKIASVNQCAVVIQTINNEKRIIAYMVINEKINHRELRNNLKLNLPQHMIPFIFIEILSMPLSPNGKTDFKSLPKVQDKDLMMNQEYVSPKNETENELVKIWVEVLDVDNIGVTNNFFELGGHSLMAIKVVSRIKNKFKIELNIADFFFSPTIEELSLLIDKLPAQESLPLIKASKYPKEIPLSFAQERLWFVDRFEGSQHYHVPIVLEIKGNLNVQILEDSFNEIIDRHEVLRTIFIEVDGIPYQKILDNNSWKLNFLELEDAIAADTIVEEEIKKPFDLSKDFLVRSLLIKQSNSKFVFVLVMHHIITDGWSNPIFVNELIEIYQAKSQNREVNLPKLNVQYADYAIWQKKHFVNDFFSNKLKYWKNKLDGVAPLALSTDFPRTLVKNNQGDSIDALVDKKLFDKILNTSLEEDVTVFMILMTAMKILFHKYTGQNDICLGTVVANRNQGEIEPLIGFFVNSLPIRSAVDPHMSFRDVLQEVKKSTLEAFSNQDVPFEKIVEATVEGREISRTPIFQVIMAFQNNVQADNVNLEEITITPTPLKIDSSKLDITFNISENGNGLNINTIYNNSLFLRGSIEQMVNQFITILQTSLDSLNVKIDDISLLSKRDTQFLDKYNWSSVTYPKDKTIVDLFEEQVVEVPNNIALVFNNQQLSYQQLNEKSNQLAAYLKSKGVEKGTLVAICVERSLEAIIAMYAVMKAGGAFVPIDTTYPKDRINYILEDTGTNYLIINDKYRDLVEESAVENIISLDDWSLISECSSSNLGIKITPSDLMYILYTSGSTGKPKGVMLQHYSLLDHLYGVIPYTKLDQCKSFLLTSSFSADGGYTLVFAASLLGQTLHVITNELLLNSNELKNYVVNNDIDCIKTVPSLWLSYAESDSLLIPNKTLMLGGEVFPLKIVEYLKAYDYKGRVYNNYGPTETTIGKIMHEVDIDKMYSNVPIGKPISNTQLYVVNTSNQLCPSGIPGELWIGGNGVAKGYLNREELTAEKFINNPFSDNNEMLYRTGDVVKWLPDGEIEFIGRVDEQVQIRGYRVELNEIENVILTINGIKQASVLVKEESGVQIYAFIVGDNVEVEFIRNYLKEKLPEYMIPLFIIEVNKIPLTTNAKVDKKELFKIKVENDKINEIEIFQNDTEEKLGVIWKDILNIDSLGRNNNFFELGGHSLKAVQVISAVNQKFNKNISIKDLFLNATISQLAVIISDSENKTSTIPLLSVQLEKNDIPLSFSQERLWIIDKIQGSTNYHIPLVLKLHSHVDKEILEKSFKALLKRHEVLRTILEEKNNHAYQKIIGEHDWQLEHLKINESDLENFINSEIAKPFDLSKDYLIRASATKSTGISGIKNPGV